MKNNKPKDYFIHFIVARSVLIIIVFFVFCFSPDKVRTLFYIFLLSAFVMFILAIVLGLGILRESSPRTAGIELLYPSVFFAEVFKKTEIVGSLEQKVIAIQKHTEGDDGFEPIVESIRELRGVYRDSIKEWLGGNQSSNRIDILKSDISLSRKILIEEKDSFLETNGNAATSFIFNRQNYLTDVILTGMGVPLLMEILKKNIDSMGDVWGILWNDIPILASGFIMVFVYRVMKYQKNKLSMIRTSTRVAMYQKVGLLLDIFEVALNDTERE